MKIEKLNLAFAFIKKQPEKLQCLLCALENKTNEIIDCLNQRAYIKVLTNTEQPSQECPACKQWKPPAYDMANFCPECGRKIDKPAPLSYDKGLEEIIQALKDIKIPIYWGWTQEDIDDKKGMVLIELGDETKKRIAQAILNQIIWRDDEYLRNLWLL